MNNTGKLISSASNFQVLLAALPDSKQPHNSRYESHSIPPLPTPPTPRNPVTPDSHPMTAPESARKHTQVSPGASFTSLDANVSTVSSNSLDRTIATINKAQLRSKGGMSSGKAKLPPLTSGMNVAATHALSGVFTGNIDVNGPFGGAPPLPISASPKHTVREDVFRGFDDPLPARSSEEEEKGEEVRERGKEVHRSWEDDYQMHEPLQEHNDYLALFEIDSDYSDGQEELQQELLEELALAEVEDASSTGGGADVNVGLLNIEKVHHSLLNEPKYYPFQIQFDGEANGEMINVRSISDRAISRLDSADGSGDYTGARLHSAEMNFGGMNRSISSASYVAKRSRQGSEWLLDAPLATTPGLMQSTDEGRDSRNATLDGEHLDEQIERVETLLKQLQNPFMGLDSARNLASPDLDLDGVRLQQDAGMLPAVAARLVQAVHSTIPSSSSSSSPGGGGGEAYSQHDAMIQLQTAVRLVAQGLTYKFRQRHHEREEEGGKKPLAPVATPAEPKLDDERESKIRPHDVPSAFVTPKKELLRSHLSHTLRASTSKRSSASIMRKSKSVVQLAPNAKSMTLQSGSTDGKGSVGPAHSPKLLHTIANYVGSCMCVTRKHIWTASFHQSVHTADRTNSGIEVTEWQRLWGSDSKKQPSSGMLPSSGCIVHRIDTSSTVLCMHVVDAGRFVVAGTSEGELLVYSASSFLLVDSIPDAHDAAINCIGSYVNDATGETFLLTGSSDHTVREWGLADLEFVCTLVGHDGPVRCVLAVGPFECWSGSDDGDVRVWKRGKYRALLSASSGGDLANDDACVVLRQHGSPVLALQAVGTRVWSCSLAGSIHLYSIEGSKELVHTIQVGRCVFGFLLTQGHVWACCGEATLDVSSPSSSSAVLVYSTASDPPQLVKSATVAGAKAIHSLLCVSRTAVRHVWTNAVEKDEDCLCIWKTTSQLSVDDDDTTHTAAVGAGRGGEGGGGSSDGDSVSVLRREYLRRLVGLEKNLARHAEQHADVMVAEHGAVMAEVQQLQSLRPVEDMAAFLEHLSQLRVRKKELAEVQAPLQHAVTQGEECISSFHQQLGGVRAHNLRWETDMTDLVDARQTEIEQVQASKDTVQEAMFFLTSGLKEVQLETKLAKDDLRSKHAVLHAKRNEQEMSLFRLKELDAQVQQLSRQRLQLQSEHKSLLKSVEDTDLEHQEHVALMKQKDEDSAALQGEVQTLRRRVDFLDRTLDIHGEREAAMEKQIARTKAAAHLKACEARDATAALQAEIATAEEGIGKLREENARLADAHEALGAFTLKELATRLKVVAVSVQGASVAVSTLIKDVKKSNRVGKVAETRAKLKQRSRNNKPSITSPLRMSVVGRQPSLQKKKLHSSWTPQGKRTRFAGLTLANSTTGLGIGERKEHESKEEKKDSADLPLSPTPSGPLSTKNLSLALAALQVSKAEITQVIQSALTITTKLHLGFAT